MGPVTQRWTWRRWQLVRVAIEGHEVVLDAIELLAPGQAGSTAGPVTVRFRDRQMTGVADETLGAQLERWREAEDGMCDVFERADEPFSVFAMFQGPDSVIFAHYDLGDDLI